LERTVIDASIAVKWFVNEKDSDRALQLRSSYLDGAIELVAPNLILYEVADALRFHPHCDFTEANLLDSIDALRDMQIAVALTTETWLKAFSISLSENLSIYDAVYLAMSEVLKTTLITSDKELVGKLDRTLRFRVRLLQDLKPSD
jgi:predicted nucleic acid-binding protein